MPTKKISLSEAIKQGVGTAKPIPPRDEDIDFSDAPELDLNDPLIWETIKVCPAVGKKRITIRLDTDLLQWFKKKKRYQSHINKVLRAYFEAHKDEISD